MNQHRQLEIDIISQEQVLESGVLDVSSTLPALRAALIAKALGKVLEPAPATLGIDLDRGQRLVAHASLIDSGQKAAGVKWIGANPENPDRDQMPRASAVVLLSDPLSGRLEALVEGTVLSSVRTAAVVGLAAQALANPASGHLLLVGAGVSNRASLRVMRQIFPHLHTVEVFDIDVKKAQTWAAQESGAEGEVRVVESLGESLTRADVIITATTDNAVASLSTEGLKPGCFVGAISMNDVAVESVADFSRIVTTDLASLGYKYSAVANAFQSQLIPETRIELLQNILLATEEHQNQFTPGQSVLFEVWGLGLFDIALAANVLQRARDKGSTNKVSLWNEPLWW